MRTFPDNPSIGVFGSVWAKQTVEYIKSSLLLDRVFEFKYSEREALFIDQYEFFIITDFGKNSADWSVEYRNDLNKMREIIATRSMKTILFANNDDADISTSLCEACCRRVVRIDNLRWQDIPHRFTTELAPEVFKLKERSALVSNLSLSTEKVANAA